MDDPEFWRWMWLGAALVFGLGEMTSPGSFFLAPFAVGAIVAAVLSFLGVGIGLGWLAFVLVSGGSFLALRPLARRLDRADRTPVGVGASRLVGEQGLVLEAIPAGPDEIGLIRVGREEWRAQSAHGDSISVDSVVTITEVKGTRVIVLPIGLVMPPQPPERSS